MKNLSTGWLRNDLNPGCLTLQPTPLMQTVRYIYKNAVAVLWAFSLAFFLGSLNLETSSSILQGNSELRPTDNKPMAETGRKFLYLQWAFTGARDSHPDFWPTDTVWTLINSCQLNISNNNDCFKLLSLGVICYTATNK